ncbi:MAG: EndoU domain-containing protein [Nitrosomonas sp.]|nr:EndoU domain-containing protein [Nitrosomonas sp.]
MNIQHKRFEVSVMSGVYAVAVFLLLSSFPLQVLAQVDCSALRHWVTLENKLQMNQKHLFCGEWDRNRPKGFHSRPGGVNPATVAGFVIQDKASAAGIYTGRWSYQGHPGRNKFSTLFPDSCSVEQVLNSIAYAAGHQYTCPAGAPDWTLCGFNQPDTGTGVAEDGKYCSVNNQRFTIGFAPPKNGRINTAFPLFE